MVVKYKNFILAEGNITLKDHDDIDWDRYKNGAIGYVTQGTGPTAYSADMVSSAVSGVDSYLFPSKNKEALAEFGEGMGPSERLFLVSHQGTKPKSKSGEFWDYVKIDTKKGTISNISRDPYNKDGTVEWDRPQKYLKLVVDKKKSSLFGI